MSTPPSPGPSIVRSTTASTTIKSTSSPRGISVFPVARISKIIKADQEIDICSKEATFLISIATELFLKKLTDQAYTNAKLDKRKHIFYKDLSRAVQQTEYFEFLKDAIPTPIALSSALQARHAKLKQKQTEEHMILEGTLQDEDQEEEEQEEEEAAQETAMDGEEAASKPSKNKTKSGNPSSTASAADDDEAMQDNAA